MKHTIFICSKCDAQTPKWTGQCLECGSWGTIAESGIPTKGGAAASRTDAKPLQVSSLATATVGKESRTSTGISEIDRVFGGGIVDGSVTLLGGEPGIGKSTIALSLAAAMTKGNAHVLYVSGEESAAQVKMRADRMGLPQDRIMFLAETDVDRIGATVRKEKPALVVIDSIQTLHTPDLPAPMGSPNQVRYAAARIVSFAKRTGIPMIIIGHVTKDGSVAGPKTLEHLVDTVFSFEGERTHALRLLRVLKNRFGSTDETGMFEMTGKGLIEVKNPSAYLLDERRTDVSGSTISCVLEGTRPILLEMQALVQKTSFGYPTRRATGFDQTRMEMLIAILARRGGIDLGQHDAYINVIGGMKIREPGADLAVLLSLTSAYGNIPVPEGTAVWGEVGLGGEIRSAPSADKRLMEARRLGIRHVITSLPRSGKVRPPDGLRVTDVKTVKDAILVIRLPQKKAA